MGNPVPFLGRVFIDPWTSPTNFCDVKRRAAALHLTLTPAIVPREVILYRKAISYMITDGNTPLISHWCKAVLRLLDCSGEERWTELTRRDISWFSNFEESFCQPREDDDEVWAHIANSLDVTVAELRRYCNFLDSIRNQKDFDTFPPLMHIERKVQVSAVVGGQVVDP